MNTEELFIYLGKQQNIFFFIHTVKNVDYDRSMTMQIYNCLISESMIFCNDVVVIYEFDGDELNVIIVQHIDNKANIKFNKNNLQQQFTKLLAMKRNHNILVFAYNGVFLTYEVPVKLQIFNKIVIVNNILYENTAKTIDY